MNTVNFVTIAASIAPDQEIVVFGPRRLTYGALSNLIARLSGVFKKLGLKRHDVIAVLDTNSDLYVASYYAAASAGLTFLPLNYRAKENELHYMLNTAEAKAVLVGDRYVDLILRLRPQLKAKELVALGEGRGMARLEELLRGARPEPAEVEVDDDDTSVLMYTSGTTALAKAVMLSYRDFTAYVTANIELADGTERGVALVCVPFYHIAGMTAMMSNIWTGRKMIIMAQFEAARWLELIERERITHAFVVPTMMKQILDEPSFARADLSSLTNLAYGGAPMALPVIRRAIGAFPPNVGFVNAYGQTETTSSLTVLGPDDHRLTGDPARDELKLRRLSSVGKPLPDVEVAVRAENGKVLERGELGEIVVRTPRTMKGYVGGRDDAALEGGWRATGDLGWIDEDGYVFFGGRKDDIIIRAGENIAPAEIEAMLMSHPAVSEAAVVGEPSLEWGEIIKAFVVLHRGAAASAEDLKRWCGLRLASFKRPEKIEFVDSLPKNFLGKILRNELRQKK